MSDERETLWSKDRLSAVWARTSAATPGPWEWQTSNSFARLGTQEHDGCVLHGVRYNDGCLGIEGRNIEADSAFIAHARIDLQDALMEMHLLQCEFAEERAHCGWDLLTAENDRLQALCTALTAAVEALASERDALRVALGDES